MVYAVIQGHEGNKVYQKWSDVQINTKGAKGSKFHKFDTVEDCNDWIEKNTNSETSLFLDRSSSIDRTVHNYPFAYVDGSFNPKTFEYGYGVVLIENENSKQIELFGSGKEEDRVKSRNIAGELAAATEAISYALKNGLTSIDIYYDYQGIGFWGDQKWSTVKPWIQDYINFVEESRGSGLKINFIWVKGHTGVKYNEIVDKLAKKGCGVL